jgi:amidase
MSSVLVVTSDRRAFSFDRALPPVLEVDPGSTVRFETSDEVLARLAAGEPLEEIGIHNINAVTGPVLVRGAQPGDALRVDVLAIEVERVWALWLGGFGPLGGRIEGVRALETHVEDGRVRIGAGLTVPLEPMIGCIGVAPAEGAGSTTRPVYRFGGNLDLRELSPGATLWLPVEVPGALLSLGDLHAAMGQGEPAFVSLEAGGAATVRLALDRGLRLPAPRLRAGAETICVGLGESYPEARQHAVDQAFELLTSAHGLEPLTAYAYTCARVALRAAGPAGSMVEGLQAVLAVVPDPA